MTSDYFLVQQPPGALNWCIGCVGKRSPTPDHDPGTFDAEDRLVSPASLYDEQLRERLGAKP